MAYPGLCNQIKYSSTMRARYHESIKFPHFKDTYLSQPSSSPCTHFQSISQLVTPNTVPRRSHPGNWRHVTSGTGSGRVSSQKQCTDDPMCSDWAGGYPGSFGHVIPGARTSVVGSPWKLWTCNHRFSLFDGVTLETANMWPDVKSLGMVVTLETVEVWPQVKVLMRWGHRRLWTCDPRYKFWWGAVTLETLEVWVKTNSMLPKTNKSTDRSSWNTWLRLGVRNLSPQFPRSQAFAETKSNIAKTK